MNREAIQDALGKYEYSIWEFILRTRIPEQWFGQPDHLAIKAQDIADFGRIVKDLEPDTKRVTCTEIDERFIAVAELRKSIGSGLFKATRLVEVMEIRPDKTDTDNAGLDHMEFLLPPDSENIERKLNDKSVVFQHESNGSHSWFSIDTGTPGVEIKLSDRPLAEIIEEQLADGTSRIVYQRESSNDT